MGCVCLTWCGRTSTRGALPHDDPRGLAAYDYLQIAGRFLLAEYIYTMRKTRKAHGDKVILDDVTLSFLPGAKIGVVGPERCR